MYKKIIILLVALFTVFSMSIVDAKTITRNGRQWEKIGNSVLGELWVDPTTIEPSVSEDGIKCFKVPVMEWFTNGYFINNMRSERGLNVTYSIEYYQVFMEGKFYDVLGGNLYGYDDNPVSGLNGTKGRAYVETNYSAKKIYNYLDKKLKNGELVY